MEHITLKKGAKYFYVIFFLVVLLISYLMLRPFVNAILISVILAYIFYPIYRHISKYIKNKNISSIIMVFVVLLIVILPSILLVQLTLQQFRTFSVELKDLDFELLSYVDEIEERLDLPALINLEVIVDSLSNDLSRGFTNIITKFIRSIPFRVLETFIIIFILFYLFKDGERLLKSAKESIPIKKIYKEELFSEAGKVIRAVVYGTLVAAVAQGIVGAIGFYIFGIDNFLIWGLVMAMLALIPFLGPAFVWVPASLYFMFNDQLTKGILLFIYGTLLISSIDNIIKARIISKQAKVHLVIVFLGLMGGIATFGIAGVVMGPLILSLLIVFVRIYLRERKLNNNYS